MPYVAELLIGAVTLRPLAQRPRVLHEVFDGLPDVLRPTRCGQAEPIRHPFDLDDLSRFANCWSERGSDLLFRYTGRMRGTGRFLSSRTPHPVPNRISFELHYERILDRGLEPWVPHWLENLVRATDPEFAYATVNAGPTFKGWCADAVDDYAPVPVDDVLITRDCRCEAWLNSIHPFPAWAVYGPTLTALMGRDRLLALPAHECAARGDHVWLRMCERLHDLHRPEVLARRNAMFESLDLGASVFGRGRRKDDGTCEYDMPPLDLSALYIPPVNGSAPT